MAIIAAKFGGSSVADANQIRKVKSIIKGNPDRKYIVVSAPGKRCDDDTKITDLLYRLKSEKESGGSYAQTLGAISERFLGIEADLEVSAGIAGEMETIESEIEKDASEDYLASRGEYLAARLVAEFLGFDFVDAAGLVQFDEKGKLLSEETNEALRKELAGRENAVIPGFYGTMPDGGIKTFSRGGSDISGAIVARAVSANMYENWTDVSGILMTDPRIVENPKPIRHITYGELRELSYMGATVLHESAVFPARQADIPINIKNTNEPNHPGTIVSNTVKGENFAIISGIAGHKDFTFITITKPMMSEEVGILRKALAVLERHDVSIEHIPGGVDTFSIVVANRFLQGKADTIVKELRDELDLDSVEVTGDVAIIATVGNGMVRRKGVSAKLFTALYKAGINIRMIDQGSSEVNIIVGVDNSDFEAAIRAIYKAFAE
ncbi:MAG: aspartate kinase [Clostridiales Family XIII bacterium]|jgi:aspartate kinase|nr:aspartate kinase [Clostridiales Family XIII bacterium]